MKKNLLIVYLVAAGQGISGGTRIHIECTKQWLQHKTFDSIKVWASNDGYAACRRNGLPAGILQLMDTGFTKKINFWVDYIARTIKGIFLSFFYKLNSDKEYIIYAASDFWADFFPALIIHLRYKQNTKLVTPIYLFAPPPLVGYDGKRSFNIKLIIYYLMQQIMMFFCRRFSQAIFVTYSPDLKRLKKLQFKKQPHFVIVGGIEFDKTTKYAQKKDYLYDAIFVGRYHPQKGIWELLTIWKKVVQLKPYVKLAILGNGVGDFEQRIRDFIKSNNLQHNIYLLGFKDGEEKYRLFSQTKIYLNTNLYDAGGMATMEAMSCGLPVVSFDFPNSRSMIGDGVLWASYLDLDHYTEQIITFLNYEKLISKYGAQARENMRQYDWSETAKRVASYFHQIK